MTRPLRIAIVGLPGVGKSTTGRRIAKLINWRFIDLDRWIEARLGKTIATIFEQSGEAAFRRYETEATAILARENGLILATGGGWVLSDAPEQLGERAGILYLKASPEEALIRMGKGVDRRPLLRDAEDPQARLEGLLAVRGPLYEKWATAVLETVGLSSAEVARRAAVALGWPMELDRAAQGAIARSAPRE